MFTVKGLSFSYSHYWSSKCKFESTIISVLQLRVSDYLTLIVKNWGNYDIYQSLTWDLCVAQDRDFMHI